MKYEYEFDAVLFKPSGKWRMNTTVTIATDFELPDPSEPNDGRAIYEMRSLINEYFSKHHSSHCVILDERLGYPYMHVCD